MLEEGDYDNKCMHYAHPMEILQLNGVVRVTMTTARPTIIKNILWIVF